MNKSLVFSTHALRRMLKHRIKSEEIRSVLERGERIEEYPQDEPLASYLTLGTAPRVLHVVAADDVTSDETIVVTAYEPNLQEWEPGYRTRRKR